MKKSRKLFFSEIDFDCLSHIVSFFGNSNDFISLSMVVVGFYKYVKILNPGCCRNIAFHLKNGEDLPEEEVLFVSTILCETKTTQKRLNSFLKSFPRLKLLENNLKRIGIEEFKPDKYNPTRLKCKSKFLETFRTVFFNFVEISIPSLTTLNIGFPDARRHNSEEEIDEENMLQMKFFDEGCPHLRTLSIVNGFIDDLNSVLRMTPKLEVLCLIRPSTSRYKEFYHPTLLDLKVNNFHNSKMSFRCPNLNIFLARNIALSEGTKWEMDYSKMVFLDIDYSVYEENNLGIDKLNKFFSDVISKCRKLEIFRFYYPVFIMNHQFPQNSGKTINLRIVGLKNLKEVSINYPDYPSSRILEIPDHIRRRYKEGGKNCVMKIVETPNLKKIKFTNISTVEFCRSIRLDVLKIKKVTNLVLNFEDFKKTLNRIRKLELDSVSFNSLNEEIILQNLLLSTTTVKSLKVNDCIPFLQKLAELEHSTSNIFRRYRNLISLEFQWKGGGKKEKRALNDPYSMIEQIFEMVREDNEEINDEKSKRRTIPMSKSETLVVEGFPNLKFLRIEAPYFMDRVSDNPKLRGIVCCYPGKDKVLELRNMLSLESIKFFDGGRASFIDRGSFKVENTPNLVNVDLGNEESEVCKVVEIKKEDLVDEIKESNNSIFSFQKREVIHFKSKNSNI